MKELLPLLKEQPLFRGFAEQEILSVLTCITAHRRAYKKNNFVLSENQRMNEIGILLYGKLHNVKTDYDGNQTIVDVISPGGTFGEALVCADAARHNVTILAVADSEVLFLNYQKILSVCGNACRFHTLLIRNLLMLLAKKNLFFNRKLEHVTQRSTREKLLSYLFESRRAAGSERFEIPLNRQQLADYLAIDRSAMSARLCKLRDEGILEFNRNAFYFPYERRR